MTYSDKYALLKAYKIETGDDPDQNASEPMKKNEYTKNDPPKEAEAEIEKIKAGLINKVQIASIEAELDRTGVKALQITKKYGVANLAELNFGQWKDIMANFEVTADKKKTELPL